MDIVELIKTAKIGSERKAAQIDSCAPFAAALYDVLIENGLDVSLVTACHRAVTVDRTWYHLVVEHDGTYYDSLGEFSTEMVRKRLKIHPKIEWDLTYRPEPREDCYDEDDFADLHDFFVDAFRAAAKRLNSAPAPALADTTKMRV